MFLCCCVVYFQTKRFLTIRTLFVFVRSVTFPVDILKRKHTNICRLLSSTDRDCLYISIAPTLCGVCLTCSKTLNTASLRHLPCTLYRSGLLIDTFETSFVAFISVIGFKNNIRLETDDISYTGPLAVSLNIVATVKVIACGWICCLN